MKKLVEFLNSGAGLMLLGFLVTTVGGTILNFMIQERTLNNERRFEMFQIRLEEAKALQDKLLEETSARSVGLAKVILTVDTATDDRQAHLVATEKLWRETYTEVKDDWNRELIQLHSGMRILFPDLADLLLADEAWGTRRQPPVEELLDDARYEATKPQSVHGAFVATHATAYHLVFKCQTLPCENWDDLIRLVYKQMAHHELLVQCLSFGVADQLLANPYDPAVRPTSPPPRCAPHLPSGAAAEGI